MYFRELLRSVRAGRQDQIGRQQSGVAAGGERFPDVNAVREDDDFHLWGEAFHPHSRGRRDLDERPELRAVFFWHGHGRKNESPFCAAEAANGDVGVADGIFMRDGRVIESEKVHRALQTN